MAYFGEAVKLANFPDEEEVIFQALKSFSKKSKFTLSDAARYERPNFNQDNFKKKSFMELGKLQAQLEEKE